MTTVDTRAEWLRWRRSGIGASDIAALLGISPWASPFSVWADKLGLLPDEELDDDDVREFGRRLDALALEFASAPRGGDTMYGLLIAMYAPIFEMAGNIAGAASQINLLAGGINSMLPAFEALLGLVLLKQGVGLLGAFRELAVALPALAANMGTLGVAVATYFASDRVVALVTALVEWRKATGQLAEAQQQAAKIQQDAIPTLDRFATTTGITVKSIDEAIAHWSSPDYHTPSSGRRCVAAIEWFRKETER